MAEESSQRTLRGRASRLYGYIMLGMLPFIGLAAVGLMLWTFWSMFGFIFVPLLQVSIENPVRVLAYLAGIVALSGVFAVTGYLIEGRVMEALADD